MILVSGVNGFIGQALSRRLCEHGKVRGSVRSESSALPCEGMEIVEASLSAEQDWSRALDGVSVIVHCAARVHVMKDGAGDPLTEFRRINVAGTLNLARQAAVAGVRRFIYLSSVKVNGEVSLPGRPFTPEQEPSPCDPYGVSKWEAEVALRDLVQETAMELVIVRPPLVYGPGVKANFLSMMKCVARGVPLPFGCVTENRRSMVYLENLVDLLVTCVDHPAAANQIFLVSDDEDLSTAGILRLLGEAVGRPARLIPVPVQLIELGARMLGRTDIARRLCGSLQVDPGPTRRRLGWSPPFSVAEGVRRTVEQWQSAGRDRRA